ARTRARTRTSRPRLQDEPLVGGIDDQLAGIVHDLAVPREDDQRVRLDGVEVRRVAARLDEAGGGPDVRRADVADGSEREPQRGARGADLVDDQDAAPGGVTRGR